MLHCQEIDQNNLLCHIAKNQVDAILLNIEVEEYCFEERRGNKLERRWRKNIRDISFLFGNQTFRGGNTMKCELTFPRVRDSKGMQGSYGRVFANVISNDSPAYSFHSAVRGNCVTSSTASWRGLMVRCNIFSSGNRGKHRWIHRAR